MTWKKEKPKKKRSKSTYYGKTRESIERQRMNLTPGNTFAKRRKREIRLDCWFKEAFDLEDRQCIYEGFVNDREPAKMTNEEKKELKNEEFLNDWWDSEVELDQKRLIYKEVMGNWFNPKDKEEILKDMYECLKKKIEAGEIY